MTPTINVIIKDLKQSKDNAVVAVNSDGSYTIFINARLDSESQYKEYMHELHHIEGGDYERHDVQEIEADAHGIIKRTITPEEIPDWLKSLRKDHVCVKRALLTYNRRRKFMEENGIIKPDTMHDAPISFDKEIQRINNY